MFSDLPSVFLADITLVLKIKPLFASHLITSFGLIQVSLGTFVLTQTMR